MHEFVDVTNTKDQCFILPLSRQIKVVQFLFCRKKKKISIFLVKLKSCQQLKRVLGHNLYYVRGPKFILPIPASGVQNLYYSLASGVHNLYYIFKSQRQGFTIYTIS